MQFQTKNVAINSVKIGSTNTEICEVYSSKLF